MADKKINFRSDIIEIFNWDTEKMDVCPFAFTYYIAGNEKKGKFIAEWDGVDNDTVQQVEPGVFRVLLNNHGLTQGKLNVLREFKVPSTSFKDNVFNQFSNESTGIVLNDGVLEDSPEFESYFSVSMAVGNAGKSAYQVAVEAGYIGTETDYANHMAALPLLVGNSNFLGIFENAAAFDSAYTEKFAEGGVGAWGFVGSSMSAMGVVVRNANAASSNTIGGSYDLTDFSAAKAATEKVRYLTQSEYDALIASGTFEADVTYNIYED